MKDNINGNRIAAVFERLVLKYSLLSDCRADIEKSFYLLKTCFENSGKLLLCGNGGSAADCSHIAGELMKGFLKKRELSDTEKRKYETADPERGRFLAGNLQGALPAIALNSNTSIITAVLNDIEESLIYAQQVKGYGRPGDILMCISTSGNAENVLNAAAAAQASGLKVIGLTGKSGGNLCKYCNCCIRVPETSVTEVQELHIPVYHALCAAVEEYFFN